jgi:hypothetical protein
MPNLKFTNEKGQIFEIDGISVEEIAKLAGLNGHSRNGSPSPVLPPAFPATHSRIRSSEPDYAGFKRKLTTKAKQFLAILAQNPTGISADHLASQLGFQSGVQLGGMAGGGLAKHAGDFNIDLSYVYIREKRFVNGVRSVIYKPGAYLNALL